MSCSRVKLQLLHRPNAVNLFVQEETLKAIEFQRNKKQQQQQQQQQQQ